uniref:Insulin-like prepropeptide ILP1 n=1 Tax=Aurelia aurita TaxID=6145 RepID=A0A1T4JH36_AURAU|nr:Insulin-like prepropeptide ILP1 [Aurelia aurita]
MPRLTTVGLRFIFMLIFASSITLFIQSTEVKVGNKLRLCGPQIFQAVAYCCMAGCHGRRVERDIEGQTDAILKKISKEDATSFLLGNRRKKRFLSSWWGTNPDEECCQETCTFEEIAEYSCS